jgi:putative OPT family oligopeptide transporter
MIPLRRAMIVERTDLTYPEGVACAEVLRAGDTGGRGLVTITGGVLIGGVVKALVEGVGILRGALEGAFASGRSLFYTGTYVSPALIAVGYIVKLRVAAQVFLGGALMWFVALPILGGYDGGDPIVAAKAAYGSSLRYIGVGAMLVGGVSSIWNVRHGILGGVRAMRGFGAGAGGPIARTDRDMPFTALIALFTFSMIGVFALYEFLLDSQLAAIASTIVMVAAAFLFVAVATYIVGLVGSSNSPVSGMTICALLLASAVMLAVGVRGESAMFAVLGVAGVVCCAACTSGDIAQDLKTGQLVGATPANQQWMQVISVIVPAFVFAPILTVLHNSGGIGDKFQAPQATLFASLTKGFFGDGELPLNLVYIGIGIGLTALAINFALARLKYSFRLYLMPVAVGMYLPLLVTAPILIGGLLHWLVNRGREDRAADAGVLLGSGMIAGEALVGIGLAAAAPSGVFPLVSSASLALTIATFLAMLVAFGYLSRTESSANTLNRSER